MNAKEKYPKTLIQAVRYFSDLDVAHAFFTDVRWPDGVVCCPTCGSVEVKYLAKYRRWECKEKHSRRQFTVKVGTIMEDSPLGLDKWAVAFWLEANAKNSISSYEVHRALGITQKSAWFMQHRIRLAMQAGSFDKMGGIIEADETFIGGAARNMHKAKRDRIIGKSTGYVGKTAVMGLLERHSDKKHSTVRACVLNTDPKKTVVQPIVQQHVAPGATVVTDAAGGYVGLSSWFDHQVIDHAEKYVDGAVHTNGIENFWALFKRCIKGTHVSVEPFHLFRYVDSEAFRFNNRECTDGDRFLLATSGYVGKRLTYKALTSAPEQHPSSGGGDKGEGNADLPN